MHDAHPALERIRVYVARHREALRTPGLALAVTDADRTLGVVLEGHANADARTRVEPWHRFQIGSISKGFTAMALLQEVEAGRLDLDAPVRTYLPWFEVQTEHTPITVHHLLSHTAGIVLGTDVTGEAAHEVWLLRETHTGWAPGERFNYSNVGYKALGLVLEAVTGRPWWETVRERVMAPIGMGEADVIITDAGRARLATGYTSPFDDRTWEPSFGWAPAPWFRSATAAGTICATGDELAPYARLLLRRGRGVLAPQSFERMIRPVAEDPQAPGHRFGYGLKWLPDGDGRTYLGHSGGMVGFTAYLLVDVRAGFGVTVLMNSALGERLGLARFALSCLAAHAAGEPPPEVPDEPELAAAVEGTPPAPGVPFDPAWAPLLGRYRSWNPWAPGFDVLERGGAMWIELLGDAMDLEGPKALAPLADGSFSVGAPLTPSRVRFDTPIGGRPTRAVFDAAPFYRSDAG